MAVLKEKNGDKIADITVNGVTIKNMDLQYKYTAMMIDMRVVGCSI